MTQANDSTNDGTANGAPAPQGDAGQSPANGAGATGGDSPTIEQLAQKVNELSNQRQQDQLTILDLTNRLSQTEREEEEKPEPVDPLAALTDEQLAGMSNRDLIRTAVEAMTKQIDATVLPRIQSQLGQINETVADQAARKDVADTAAKHADFWDYRAPMLALSQQPRYASLGAEDLYMLAKSKTGGSSAPSRTAPSSTAPKVETLPRATTGAPPAKSPAQATADANATSEKPNASAGAGDLKREFKSSDEAVDDAYAKVFGKK